MPVVTALDEFFAALTQVLLRITARASTASERGAPKLPIWGGMCQPRLRIRASKTRIEGGLGARPDSPCFGGWPGVPVPYAVSYGPKEAQPGAIDAAYFLHGAVMA